MLYLLILVLLNDFYLHGSVAASIARADVSNDSVKDASNSKGSDVTLKEIQAASQELRDLLSAAHELQQHIVHAGQLLQHIAARLGQHEHLLNKVADSYSLPPSTQGTHYASLCLAS